MQGFFTPLSEQSCAEGQIARYQHSSGVSHYNLTGCDSGQHVGVFIVKTPCDDDSGLTHALEHLVFRKSALFPEPQTLFQLTTFSNININASTLNGLTCFHFSAKTEASLNLAIRYLLSGILAPRFNQQDVQQEVFNPETGGVIYHELCGYQSDEENHLLMQAIRGDQSAQRIHCYGGATDSIPVISLAALYQYHGKYYRPSNLTLLTSTNSCPAIHSAINQVCSLLDIDQMNQAELHRATSKPNQVQIPPTIPNRYFDNTNLVFTWWIDLAYFDSIQALATRLKEQVTELNGRLLPIIQDANAEHKFALRVVTSSANVESIHSLLIKSLQPLTASNTRFYHHNTKFNQAINKLLTIYFHHLHEDKHAEPEPITKSIISPPIISRLAKLTRAKLSDANQAKELSQTTSLQTLEQVSLINNLQENSDGSSRSVWQDFCHFKLDKQYNALRISDFIKKEYLVDNFTVGNSLVVNSQHIHSLPDIDHLVSQHPQMTIPSIPSLLTKLYTQLNENQKNKRLTSRCFKQLYATQIRKNRQNHKFNVMLTSVSLNFSELHSLCYVEVAEDHKLVAQLASQVIAASSPFLAARVTGECYCIGITYCESSNALYLYSAFDHWSESRAERLSIALSDIAKDSLYLELALNLAKQKLKQYTIKKFSCLNLAQQHSLNQLTIVRHDAEGLRLRLNQITPQVLKDFIEHLGTGLTIAK
ncbi:hypothetical protein EGH82_11410 [Vibrio ponticus]|uniref:Peptidase M16 N-terminal domain-containing protein n=1 Tax=Vibrio ponticus TaxID=265668 RepID=A0A3N3DZL4_9VIBR|nr:insulinase family protein [Vibrio ponticus]ROV59953.1 hypothetical protein EGH82_11410 [Vibrio ponticus]